VIALGDDALVIEKIPFDQSADDRVGAGRKHHKTAVGRNVDHLVVVGEQLDGFRQRFGRDDDVDVFCGLYGFFDDGQPVAVQRDDCQLIRFYGEQFAGVGGFFVVLGNGEQRGLHHFAESGCFQVQRMVRAGAGQLGEVAGVHTHDIEFRNAALDGGGVCFGGGYLHFAAGQAAHHVAQQFG